MRQLRGRLFLKHFFLHLRPYQIRIEEPEGKPAFLPIRRKKEGAARPGKRSTLW